jgi:prolyl oligopeptidase
MAEYGDPDDPKMRDVILKYSPYQNVHKDRNYPEVLFYTSTKDDRVHPGHARKMAARMLEQGHKILSYENIEGGHGGAANLEQRVKLWTMAYAFLRSRLM